MTECAHVHVSKKLVGEQSWYACDQCGQKFKLAEWDGKVKVISDPD